MSDYAGLLSEENVEAGARALAESYGGAVAGDWARLTNEHIKAQYRERTRAVLEAVANRVSELSTGGE